MLSLTLECFLRHPAIGMVQAVIHPDDEARYFAAAPASAKLLPPAPGGATRQASVYCGLRAIVQRAADGAPAAVLIHDAARPFVDAATIDRVIAGLQSHAGTLPGIRVADTLKRTDAGQLVVGTQSRDNLWRAQTPQGFRFAPILAAHERAAAAGQHDFTDDAAIAEWAGLDVLMVEGSERNRKLTTDEDCRMAADELSRPPAVHLLGLNDIRTGSGFDVHRFIDGDHVMLCGVRIAHERGLEGHSDADAPLHALTDALLGAIGDGDIGVHFPPSDAQWRGVDSAVFLRDAAARVQARGGQIAHVDITILCERPKIGPHREAMQARLADLLGIDLSRTSVKATTTERLGFTGRSEGLAAMAIATVRLP